MPSNNSEPKLYLMKQINTNSLYVAYVNPSKITFKRRKKKNDVSNPHFHGVGIKFDNISAGNLYPVRGTYIKHSGLGQKAIASHLYRVNQLY